jgi:bifunctional UDP-N-acetylglucosamine pyrophosphorylase/glucosamine-1-phosphate N-acetyltransferase
MTVEFVAIVLAAGQGTRMKSSLPKVLHPLLGIPMYAHVVKAVLEAGIEQSVLVVGHGRDAVEADVSARFSDLPSGGKRRIRCALQERQLGTGDAVRAGLSGIAADYAGWVLVLCGDTPLVHADLVRALTEAAEHCSGPLVMLSSEVADPSGYGRIVRDANGRIQRIREHKDASAEERAIREVNPGVYAIRAPFLRAALGRLSTDNAQGELYLTDVVEQAAPEGVVGVPWPFADTQGINDRAQLAECEQALRARKVRALAQSGVTVRDPSTTYIEAEVQVEPDVTLEPNVHLRGKTRVAAGAYIDTGCVLTDVVVDAKAHLKPYTVAAQSRIGAQAETGPFTHLRPECVLEEQAKVGNFVEMKKTRLGPGSKASHLSYLGDGEIGRDVNIGAGTIFCNYDGFNKHKTILEDEVFIGSDSQLIAPIRVGKGAYVATGTTLTHDVPADALALSRVKQSNKEGYAARLKARFKAVKEAAKKK